MLGQLSETVETTTKTVEALSQSGIVAILLFFIISIIIGGYLFFRSLSKRLFDDKDGILTQMAKELVKGHLEFVKHLEQQLDQLHLRFLDQQKINVDQLEVSRKIDSAIVRLIKLSEESGTNEQAEKLKSLGRLWRYHLTYLEKVAVNLGIQSEVKEVLEEMKSLVRVIE